MTLALTHSIGDMEPHVAISFLARQNPVEMIGTPTHLKNFQSRTYPVYKKCREGEWSRDQGNDQSINGPTWDSSHSQVPIHDTMKLSYACRQLFSLAVL